MADVIAPHSQRLARMRRSRIAEAIFRWLLRRLSYGTLHLQINGVTRTYGHGLPEHAVTVHDRRTFTALVRRGSTGFGESYTEGWWDVEDLTALVQFVIRNMDPLLARIDRVARAIAPLTNVQRRFARVNAGRDKANILAHYDLGNDFYQLMLDPTMMYSCAFFPSMDVTLEEASKAKLHMLCQKLELTPDDHLLEIGTGWGGLAVYAAEQFGCRVTSVTISDAQFAYATDLVSKRGLSDRITIRNQDYREITGTFDKIVSVEMIEAIGWRQLDTYFRTLARLIREDGLVAIQAIVIDDYSYERTKDSRDFIKDMIFPGGFLPSIEAIQSSVTSVSDLRLIHLQDIGRHYAETLRRWRLNLEENYVAYEALGLGETFARMWKMYLCYCEAAFLERHVSDVQLVLAKREWRNSL